MLIIALVLAVIGLAALVTAVVTGNAVIAWVCIAASVVGVVLLIVDAVRERSRKPAAARTGATGTAETGTADEFDADYPDEAEAYEADDTHADGAHADAEPGPDADADTRAVPYDERHEDEVGAEHPEEPTTR
ncbi:hypothetical protein AU195_03705 [Mycobacterium sp. IS-1496]|uniref:phage holin family protein n=1 Tax=Mycobacterium sp. IS-1496 TaxID=1772284 RepID=UPI0007415532|nr:phage holin family protein [Mycobacterium sp. IS-1496]KUI33363.1 hypothetical protein AU195_03705 [Mycobacterium sp. IS-1496]